MEVGLIPVRLGRVTSNDHQELVYIPKEAVRYLGWKKGTRLAIYIDVKRKGLLLVEVEMKKCRRR